MTRNIRPRVLLWCCPQDVLDNPKVRAQAWASLGLKAQARVQAQPPGLQAQAILSPALCRHALSAVWPTTPAAAWDLGHTPSGAPSVGGLAKHATLSLSHTRGMLACAIGVDARVGVDIEPLARRASAARISARLFAPDEQAFVMRHAEGAARMGAFLQLWTLKEALLKVLDQSILQLAPQMAFRIDKAGRAQCTMRQAAGRQLHCESRLLAELYRVSLIAQTNSTAPPVLRRVFGWHGHRAGQLHAPSYRLCAGG